MLWKDTMQLIDFDHAVYADEAEHMEERYGTIGCAAPEQYSGDVLDGRTDIYAIGAVLHYMLTGHFPGERIRTGQAELSGITERHLMCVIRKCLQKEKDKRFQTVAELEQSLKELWSQSEYGVFRYGTKRMEKSLVIAVAGSRHGVGTTHIAMGFTAYLQRCGMPAVYEEHNESGAVPGSQGRFLWNLPHLENTDAAPLWGSGGVEAVRIPDPHSGLRCRPGYPDTGKCGRIFADMRWKTLGMGEFRRRCSILRLCSWPEGALQYVL